SDQAAKEAALAHRAAVDRLRCCLGGDPPAEQRPAAPAIKWSRRCSLELAADPQTSTAEQQRPPPPPPLPSEKPATVLASVGIRRLFLMTRPLTTDTSHDGADGWPHGCQPFFYRRLGPPAGRSSGYSQQ
ncbi:hypothetical protein BOX15_Mlig004451g1, partial [Macrostomum lignano]